jgi:hypothetical protein
MNVKTTRTAALTVTLVLASVSQIYEGSILSREKILIDESEYRGK